MALGLLAWIPALLPGAMTTEGPSLVTLAAASPRPEVCRAAQAPVEGELWARVRRERRERFCVALARGYARLERAPEDALALAREARRILPAEVEAQVLEGRALLRMGNVAAAERELAVSVSAAGRPLGDLAGLRELGLASTLLDHPEQAARAYRVLVPRLDFSRDRLFARIARLEAAAAVMMSGPEGAREAALYLGEARQSAPVPGFQDLTLALFALALDRDGRSEQARVVLDELEGPWMLERFSKSRPETGALSPSGPFIPASELEAAIALAAVRLDPALAREHFEGFLSEGAKGPWASWGQRWLAELVRRNRP